MRADRCAFGFLRSAPLLSPWRSQCWASGVKGFFWCVVSCVVIHCVGSYTGAAFRFPAGWPEGRNAGFRDQEPWRVCDTPWICCDTFCYAQEESTEIGQKGLNQNQHLSVLLRCSAGADQGCWRERCAILLKSTAAFKDN